MGAHDLLPDPRLVDPVVRDDDGLARGGGRLHDAARPRAPDGAPATIMGPGRGSPTCAARMEPGLLSPRRRRRASASTAPRPAATRSRNMRRGSPRARRSARPRPRRSAVVPPRAVGLTACDRPDAVGRAGRALRRGVATVAAMRREWDALRAADRRRALRRRPPHLLRIQQHEARWWRDACLAYFQSVNGLPLPAGAAPPRTSRLVQGAALSLKRRAIMITQPGTHRACLMSALAVTAAE